MKDIFIPLLILFNGLIAMISFGGAILMIIKKKEKADHARKLICELFILIGIGCCLKISESIFFPNPMIYEQVMILPYLLITLLFQCILIFYPMEVMKPGWISFKRGLLLLSPFFVILILYYLLDFDYIKLYSLADIAANITEPDVIFRLLTIALMVSYSIMLPLIQYQEKRITLIHLGLVIYSLGTVLNTILVTITMLTGILEFYIVYIVNSLCLLVYVLYYEMRVRSYPEKEIPLDVQNPNIAEVKEATADVHQDQPKEIMPPLHTVPIKEEATLEDKLFNDILYQFDVKEIWRYSNLDIQSLAHEAGSNKTYVLKCIKNKTGYNYIEFVNRKRIDYVLNELKKNPTQNLQELFTNAGFSSRTTAWRNFKNIVGMTPTEYLKSIKQESR